MRVPCSELARTVRHLEAVGGPCVGVALYYVTNVISFVSKWDGQAEGLLKGMSKRLRWMHGKRRACHDG